MNKSKKIKFKDGILILHISDGTIYRPITGLTSDNIDQTEKIIDSQTKCDPGIIIKTLGSYSYEINTEEIDDYDETCKFLHNLMRETIFWKITTEPPTKPDYFGTAILNNRNFIGDDLSLILLGSGLITNTDQQQ